MNEEKTLDKLSLDGGCLCLDFINTVHNRSVKNPYDYLFNYKELLKWIRKTGALQSDVIEALESLYEQDGATGEKSRVEIIHARELLHEIFAAIAIGEIPDSSTTVHFNDLLSTVNSKIAIQFSGAHMTHLQWRAIKNLKFPLYPIIKSAYDLLVSNKLNRVKVCGSCGWLFLDQSKNNSRRWCSMQTCGSAVKAKKYYRKKIKKA